MSVSLTVMTFNLHEDQLNDSPNSWERRRDLCISVITSYSPIILCTQQDFGPAEGQKLGRSTTHKPPLGSTRNFGVLEPTPSRPVPTRAFSKPTPPRTCGQAPAHVRAPQARCPHAGIVFGSGVKSQLEFLQQGLPGYGQFGVSRKGSQDTSDEHCTIFYDKEKVELLEGGTFWLSESPSVPGSMSWGSVVPCIATWATFQLKRVEPPGFTFQIVNTNMDEFSPRARRRSALLTWQHIASLPPSLPVVYCGGFNTQKESMTGRFLLGRSREHGVVGDMRDAWPNARVRKNVSLIRTYHGFKGDQQGVLEFLKLIFRALCLCWDRQTQDLHIDWILFRGRSLIPVSCEVVNDHIDDMYPSSHYPIFSEFMLPRTVRLLETPVDGN